MHHICLSQPNGAGETQAMKKLTFTDSLVATQMHSKEGEIIDFVGESSVISAVFYVFFFGTWICNQFVELWVRKWEETDEDLEDRRSF